MGASQLGLGFGNPNPKVGPIPFHVGFLSSNLLLLLFYYSFLAMSIMGYLILALLGFVIVCLAINRSGSAGQE